MRIGVITDTHLGERAPALAANARAAMDFFDRSGADLTIHLGDVTLDGPRHPAEFDFAKALFADFRTPVRFIPGNHDIGDNPGAESDPAHPPPDTDQLSAWRDRFAADRWSIQADGWTLIGLNAQVLGLQDEEERAQSDWLADAVAGARGPIALFVHKPLYRDGPADEIRHPRYLPLEPRRALMRLLAGKDLRLIASGHTHQWRRHGSDGIDHLWAPSSAFVFPDEIQESIGEKLVGAALLTLGPGGHQVSLERPAGMVRHDLGDLPGLYPDLDARIERRRARARP
jgi:3',5'-cyclic AMP phosphodiesterase CpdA